MLSIRQGLAVAAVAFLCTHAAFAAQKLISDEDFGNAWPFTFEEGYLACHAGNAVTVMDAESGRMYPLNGPAQGKASALGLDDLATVWRDNPAIPGTKVSVGPVIEQGQQLCK